MPEPKRAPRLADNPPAGEKYDAMKADDGPFFALNHHVGTRRPGEVVSARDLGPGAQLQRLADAGAISAAGPDQVDVYLGNLPEAEPARDPAPAAPAKPDAAKPDAFAAPPRK